MDSLKLLLKKNNVLKTENVVVSISFFLLFYTRRSKTQLCLLFTRAVVNILSGFSRNCYSTCSLMLFKMLLSIRTYYGISNTYTTTVNPRPIADRHPIISPPSLYRQNGHIYERWRYNEGSLYLYIYIQIICCL